MKLDLVASLKEFFFDIIGFIIPGIIVLMIAKHVFNYPLELHYGTFATIVLAYVIGYIIFSFSLIKGEIYDVMFTGKIFVSSKSIKKKLSEGELFKIVSSEMNTRLANADQKLGNFNSYRSMAMSETPESNQLIYTFMFRAELFDQLHTIAVLTSIFCVVEIILSLLFDLFADFNFYWLGLFIILVLSLRKGWRRFYTISMNIPFSLYLSKIKKS